MISITSEKILDHSLSLLATFGQDSSLLQNATSEKLCLNHLKIRSRIISFRFIRLLERQNKLLRNYTQNIDTLEQQADIERVIQCHGSFATATCLRCQHRVPSNEIEKDIMEQRIPLCPKCSNASKGEEEEASTSSAAGLSAQPIMKPEIVFFGEGMPDEFHQAMVLDKEECDLIIVIGSSLKVRPVALIPCMLISFLFQGNLKLILTFP